MSRPGPSLLLVVAAACAVETGVETADAGRPSSSDSGEADEASETGEATGPAADATTDSPADPPELCSEDGPPRFELGWDYTEGWRSLDAEGPIPIVIGGQGSWMVPLGVRGDGFCVPADPYDYDRVPVLDIRIEAEGFGDPVTAVWDFPVSFEPLDGGGFGYTFIPMMIEGTLVEGLHDVHATIQAELRVQAAAPIGWEQPGVLVISD